MKYHVTLLIIEISWVYFITLVIVGCHASQSPAVSGPPGPSMAIFAAVNGPPRIVFNS